MKSFKPHIVYVHYILLCICELINSYNEVASISISMLRNWCIANGFNQIALRAIEFDAVFVAICLYDLFNLYGLRQSLYTPILSRLL